MQAEDIKPVVGRNVQHPRVGVDGGAPPVRASCGERTPECALIPPADHQRRRCIQRPDTERLDRLQRHLPNLRREVHEVVGRDALIVEWRGFGRKRLGSRRTLTRDVRRRHRPLLDWPHRLSRDSVEGEHKTLLGDLGHRLDRSSVNRDVEKVGRRRQVVVPQAMVDELVVPDTLAGLDVETEEGVGEQVVAEALPAPVVG